MQKPAISPIIPPLSAPTVPSWKQEAKPEAAAPATETPAVETPAAEVKAPEVKETPAAKESNEYAYVDAEES